jgi:hypothetical protein
VRFYKYVIILLLAYGPVSALEKTDVIFLLFGKEESQALLPVISSMERTHKAFKILAIGPAAEDLREPLLVSHTFFLKEDGITHLPVDSAWPIGKEISSEQVGMIVHYIDAKVVVSGASSAIQRQLLEKFKEKALTISYWPWIQNPQSEERLQIALSIKGAAHVHFSSSGLEEPNIRIVGNPHVNKLRDTVRLCDKKTLLESAGLDSTQRLAGVFYQGNIRIFHISPEGALEAFSDPLPSWSLEETLAVADLCLSDDEILLAAAIGAGKRAFLIDSGNIHDWREGNSTPFSCEMPDNSVEIFLDELAPISHFGS